MGEYADDAMQEEVLAEREATGAPGLGDSPLCAPLCGAVRAYGDSALRPEWWWKHSAFCPMRSHLRALLAVAGSTPAAEAPTNPPRCFVERIPPSDVCRWTPEAARRAVGKPFLDRMGDDARQIGTVRDAHEENGDLVLTIEIAPVGAEVDLATETLRFVSLMPPYPRRVGR